MKVTMAKLVFLSCFLGLVGLSAGFPINNPSRVSKGAPVPLEHVVSRKQALGQLLVGAVSGAMLVTTPGVAKADVSDGNMLPPGAAQFSRALRLKTDLVAVRKRVAENASEIDKKEWENIGKFLRTAYSIGDDMKAVAAGIGNPDNKKRALEDVELLKKYAQAGDVSVSKQDGPGFVAVADKMSEKMNDFFDSLSDVPDEI